MRHITTEAVLAELRRNEGLRRLIGIESETGVPKPWNITRFEDVLGQEPHRTLLKEVFNELIERLGVAVADLGCNTAGDATGLSARRKPAEAAQKEIDEGLPQASGGRKEYKDDEGKVTKVVEWFGFKLHLIVDVKHEVVLAYEITDTKAGDGETLPDVLKQAEANLPAGRIETLAYDKAADSDDVHDHLSDKRITPLIQMRSLWQIEPERMLPGHDGTSNVVYDEAGTIYCYDKVSDPPVRHKMAYIGHEPERETLKYRCPAKHEDWECPMSSVCNAGKSYGKTVRVPRGVDPRRFPALPRATKKFERMYKGRTAVERVNARLKVFWGVDDGNLTGSRRFAAQVGVVLAVHAVFATLLGSARAVKERWVRSGSIRPPRHCEQSRRPRRSRSKEAGIGNVAKQTAIAVARRAVENVVRSRAESGSDRDERVECRLQPSAMMHGLRKNKQQRNRLPRRAQ